LNTNFSLFLLTVGEIQKNLTLKKEEESSGFQVEVTLFRFFRTATPKPTATIAIKAAAMTKYKV
jgi:hypothetical protein